MKQTFTDKPPTQPLLQEAPFQRHFDIQRDVTWNTADSQTGTVPYTHGSVIWGFLSTADKEHISLG
jgi:hypothetical protein